MAVDAEKPVSKSGVKSEAEELEEFVAETRRKSAGSRKRLGHGNRTKYRVVNPSEQSRSEERQALAVRDENEQLRNPRQTTAAQKLRERRKH